jgi:hypothetical protein
MSFALANLPSVTTLTTALRTLEQDVGAVGSAIIKMDKTGHWVYGADQTEVDDESTWAVNPFSFVHGFIAWGDGEVLGEKMVSVTQPLPELEVAPPNAKKGWEQQVGMMIKCVSGDDKGLEARYTVTSVGGKRAIQALGVAIAEQIEKDQSKPVPVVKLKKDHYQHKSYGRIYTPVFEILEWVSMDGETEAAAPEAEPARRRRG